MGGAHSLRCHHRNRRARPCSATARAAGEADSGLLGSNHIGNVGSGSIWGVLRILDSQQIHCCGIASTVGPRSSIPSNVVEDIAFALESASAVLPMIPRPTGKSQRLSLCCKNGAGTSATSCKSTIAGVRATPTAMAPMQRSSFRVNSSGRCGPHGSCRTPSPQS